jgi:hypothetical protein
MTRATTPKPYNGKSKQYVDGKAYNGRRCKVCEHPERARIELLMARGAGQHAIGKKFEVSPDSVWRHWRNGHVAEHVKAKLAGEVLKPGVELAKLVTDESTGLLENLQRIRASLYMVFDAAIEAGERHVVAQIAARLHDNLSLGARSTGELGKHTPGTTASVLLAPAYLDLRSALLKVLRSYPDAARAVAEAFRRAEAPLLEQRAQTVAEQVPANA